MNKLTLKVENFDPEAIFTCGQCFRWHKEDDGSYTGIAKERVLNVRKTEDGIIFTNTNDTEFSDVWEEYFDLKRDYGKIIKTLSENDVIADSVEYGRGIKILRQDFFECMISFIISANNNIPRIQKIIDTMSRLWGEKVVYEGKEYYTFPSAQALDGITEEKLAPLRCGYRAKYIVNAVKSYLAGEISEEKIASLPEREARAELMKISGVGPKVADCILLFSFGRFEVFPTDVWVKRVMGELFGCEEKNATATGQQMFGEYAGIAQQYLFYKRRNEA